MKKFPKKEFFTLPNLLSFLRVPMAACFYFFYNWNNLSGLLLAVLFLILSAITDLLDGKLARHFGQVSEFGKILDPVADKITQATFILCLLHRYPVTFWLFILFLIKELTISIVAFVAVRRSGKNNGAMIYGKINTVLLYICLGALLFLIDLPRQVSNFILIVAFLSLTMSMILYLIAYIRIILRHRKDKN